jgi:hypothetical protein
MNPEEVRAWAERWKLVNRMEVEELRATTPARKFRQLGTLMALAKKMGWMEALAEGEAVVRDRWNRLRRAYGL